MQKILVLLVLLSACKTNDDSALRADELSMSPVAPCGIKSQAGDFCSVDLATVHPTQFAVGLKEVEQKQAKYHQLPTAEAKAEALRADPGIAVIGPRGEPYLIDHHHLFRALLQEHVARGFVKIADNFADLGVGEFWRLLDSKGLVFPYDENGKGPLPPEKFPTTLAELKDDPYRTLAGLVTARGGFTKETVPFLEFRWAQYFRPLVAIGEGDAGMETAVQAALAISHAPEASQLPGFIPAP